MRDEDLRRALDLARRIYGGESLRDFIVRLSPHLPPPRHYAPILAKLEEARRRPIKLGFSMPPRHGKTVLIQHAIPWWLTHFPADTCAYASYSDRQAWSKSRVIRAIAENAGITLASDAANLAEWRTLAGGGLLSGGAGSGLTGNAVTGILVVDDPFKNPEEANSQIIRDKIGDWFETVVSTRDEGMSTVVFHTRWHADDLIGRLMADEEFEIINLPALAEEGDVLGREVGEALWPDRGLPGFTKEGLEKRQKRNPWAFAALYQGRPRPRGDTIFEEPHYYDPATTDFTGCRFVLAADPAASEKTAADFSAAVVLSVLGSGDEMRAYVRHVYRQQVSVPQFAQDLLALQQRFGETRINVEAVGAFKAIPQMLRSIRPGLRITEITPLGDKLLRAQPAAAAWKAARLLVPNDSPPWLGPFLDELAKFTGIRDAHDDQVDALAHAWNSASKTRAVASDYSYEGSAILPRRY
ncbi:MAG TPA: phage terminase large subunit [Polyangia bacterium]|nr:phage terminase large subunit [Polyangia bacterium]